MSLPSLTHLQMARQRGEFITAIKIVVHCQCKVIRHKIYFNFIAAVHFGLEILELSFFNHFSVD